MANHGAQRAALQAGRKAWDIGAAAPQVVAHRVTRMALAGAQPSERDQQEMLGMVMEKQLAFSQAWWAACSTAAQNTWSMWPAWHTLASGQLWHSPAAWWKLLEQTWSPSAHVWNAALTPIHRKATSNARRLARTPIVKAPQTDGPASGRTSRAKK